MIMAWLGFGLFCIYKVEHTFPMMLFDNIFILDPSCLVNAHIVQWVFYESDLWGKVQVTATATEDLM